MNKKYLSISSDIKEKILNEDQDTEYGSLKFLLFENGNISQSQSIKFGKAYEAWFEKIIEDHITSAGGRLLPHGVLQDFLEKGKKKDLDLLYDNGTGTIYYLELKSNLNLDSEKLPTTAEKVKEITKKLQKKYSDKVIEGAVLCWGIFDMEDGIKNIKGKVRQFKKYGVDVIFPKQLYTAINKFVKSPVKSGLAKRWIKRQMELKKKVGM